MTASLRKKLYVIIFEADTKAGKAFDVILLWAIVLSIIAVMLESVKPIDKEYGQIFDVVEWVLTFAFTIEFIIRIIAVEKAKKYIFSFYGIIDFLALLPTYLSLIFIGSQYFLIIRALRLLRVFRILKLGRFIGESEHLGRALKSSRHKIVVFLGAVMTIVMIMGTVMYMVEGGDNGFTSIPRSVYWAIVTLTTVGYGDIAPATTLGQVLASIIMIMGYAIIAVPTGIVTAELGKAKPSLAQCTNCEATGHEHDAVHCKYCGDTLH
jgi:voltage-gated potassium channel